MKASVVADGASAFNPRPFNISELWRMLRESLGWRAKTLSSFAATYFSELLTVPEIR